MAKSLKDILNGVKASKIVPGSTGKDPGVDYAPKAPNEQEFVKLHKTEKHSDRVGNGDDVYQATNIKHSQIDDPKHGYTNPKDKSVNEAAKCNMTEEGTACPVHEMADCSKPTKTLREIAKNPYAIGMASAMKQTGDKPPLKKSTIVKGHDIAKAVAKEEVEQLDEVPKKFYDIHPDIFSRVEHKGKYIGTVIKHRDGSAESHRFKNPKPVGEPNTTIQLRMKHKSKEDAVNHLLKKAKEQFKEETEGFNSGALHGVGSTEINEATDLHPDYKLVKTGKKSTSAHPDGKPTYDLHYKGKKLTSIQPYSSYQDKKTPGSRIVASRKSITKYSASLPGSIMSDLNDTTAAHVANNIVRHHQASLKEDLAVPLLGGSDDDESAEMAKTQLRALANKALHLAMQLNDDQIVEPWVQSKIAVAKDYVTAVHDYMVYGDHSKDKENEQAPREGGIDFSGMTGAPTNTFPSYSVDVNTGRNV